MNATVSQLNPEPELALDGRAAETLDEQARRIASLVQRMELAQHAFTKARHDMQAALHQEGEARREILRLMGKASRVVVAGVLVTRQGERITFESCKVLSTGARQ